MFKKNHLGVATLAFLGYTRAVKINREPLLAKGQVVQWHIKEDPAFNRNYFVPDFGQDHDIDDSLKSTSATEASMGHRLNFFNEDLPKPLGGYTVPDFGVDHDVAVTQSNEKNAEESLSHEWNPTQDGNGHWVVPSPISNNAYTYVQLDTETDREPLLTWSPTQPAGHPVDYFVPDFGVDHDIEASLNDMRNTEDKLAHKLVIPEAKEPDRNYFVPDFGVDHDVENTLNNISLEEEIQKHKWTPTQDSNGFWDVPTAAAGDSYSYAANVQLDEQTDREPLLTWEPTPPGTHPINYFVPDFGVDHNIQASETNCANAENEFGDNWDPSETPHSIEFKLLQT